MSGKSTIRLLAYTGVAIPSLILFVENRFFEAGAIGWLLIVIVAIVLVESGMKIRWRKVAPSPRAPNIASNGSLDDSEEANQPTHQESLTSTTWIYDMESDKEWCPLNPKELIDYVAHKDATDVAQKQRSKMYEGKQLRVRGFVADVGMYDVDRDYYIYIQDSVERHQSWSVFAQVRRDQNLYVQALRKGDEITVTGSIDTIRSDYVRLEKSYIDHSTTIPHPKNVIEPLDKTNVPAWFLAALARSIRQIDGESDAMTSRRLLNVLNRQINEISEEFDYLGATKPRGEELRFMLTLLTRWCEHPPTFPKPDKS